MDEHSGRARTPCAPQNVLLSDSIATLCVAHAPVDPAARFPAGTVFGDWRLTAFIGRGGTGEVYCAEHVTLGTPAAVKVLVREEERAKSRFTREAKLLSSLKSTAFPRFYAYGEANGTAYLAMELLEPGDLPTGEKAIARFLLKVCDAVAELHALGYVHRDIKPANILWRTGTTGVSPVAVPVLADLGLVKGVTTSDVGHSESNVTLGGVGTPGYGAPEQLERGEVSFASDIHALGVLADQCFNGNPPRTWKRIIQRATSSIPAHRYPSITAFARAIRFRHATRYWLFVGLLVCTGLILWLENLPPSGRAVAPRPPGLENPSPVGRAVAPRPPQSIEEDSVAHEHALWRRICRPSESGNGMTVELRGTNLVLRHPLVLDSGQTYRICGPGSLDVDMTCTSTAHVHLVDCMVLNRTTLRGKKAGIFYHLDGGSYLNFVNQPSTLDNTYNVREYISLDGGLKMNFYRFRGPLTFEELLDYERSQGVLSPSMN